MHAKKASVGIWNIVKCSALCVAILACIFTPISYTFCADTTVYEADVIFPDSSFYLRVSDADGFYEDQFFYPDANGVVITQVGNASYVFTTMFDGTVALLDSPYGLSSVEYFVIYLQFYVSDSNYFDASFKSLGNFEVAINNEYVDCSLADFSVDYESDELYYVSLGIRVSASDALAVLDGSSDEISFGVSFNPVYNFGTGYYFYRLTLLNCHAIIRYTKSDQYNANFPMSPEDQEILDNMNQKGDELEESGKEISDAVQDLEDMVPDIGDPFENAPGFNQYVTGSQFFIQLFNYFYTNEMTNAFISFSLVMALVVFIMRR